jgi:class 3 adenylate cyclase
MVRYQYMLEGYDKEWSPITDKTSATFGNMNEGTYTFKLKARSPEGVWSKPVTYSFKVLPPWWRTWWMYTFYALGFLFGLRVFTKYRERALIQEKEKLEEQVALRTVQLDERNKMLEAEKQKSDKLLLNILPEEVAEELKETGQAQAKKFNNVTVLFTDFVNFSGISQEMSPTELVAEIHKNFSAFDEIIEKYGLEKIKTIGDAYMAVCGLPIETPDHAQRTINAALEIRDYITQSKGLFQIRIGVNSGEVVAGIVGVKKYAYDIWGDTVNTANRIESNSEPGKVNISGSTYALVKDYFNCESRGKIAVKGKGEIEMYFVEHQ